MIKLKKEKHFEMSLLTVFFAVFIWSVIHPHDLFTWFLEVFPAFIGLGIVIFTHRYLKLTRLAYSLLLIEAIILMIGGHYTYAEMPLFNWIKDTFHLARNDYDRLGHFMQGFVPAVIAREILLRKSGLKRGKLLSLIIVCICLAISAFYELIEWAVAEATGTAADAFLGTQGDIWDTQWDMFMALCGALLSIIVMPRIHDKFLKKSGGSN